MRGVNMADHLSRVVRELLDQPSLPAGVIVNGDCALGTGQTEDYGTFADLIEPLRKAGAPVHLAVGNHDNRERFLQALKWAAIPAIMPDKYIALVQTPRVDWYVLDSLEITNATPGLLGNEQLSWLATSLDASPEKPALVVIHHNPGLEGNFGLKDTVALLEVLRARKRVKAYLFGHTHEWKVERDSTGLHLVNLPPVAYVFKDGLPSGWVRAELRANGMSLRLQSVDPKHAAHLQTHELAWR
jgi:hypothetical protein